VNQPIDATRRALLAALAGGFALASPVAAGPKSKGKGKKKGGKAKPPLAAVIAQTIDLAVANQNGMAVFAVGIEFVVLGADEGGRVDSTDLRVAFGTVEQMRAAVVRAVQEAAAGVLGGDVPADRVAVLVI
jgi:hypothetical protein